MGAYVLDTSALLAMREGEAGSDRVHRLIASAHKRRSVVYLSFMSRMELLYCVSASEGEHAAIEALRLVDSFPVRWVTCEPSILVEAARIKASGRLSVADAWIAATARLHDAVLIHKDPEYLSVQDLKQEMIG